MERKNLDRLSTRYLQLVVPLFRTNTWTLNTRIRLNLANYSKFRPSQLFKFDPLISLTLILIKIPLFRKYSGGPGDPGVRRKNIT
ncbi:hypothetical protein BpHYR1_038440 [Brachionus plicatilis]|uniref:Uncharacterized protein n=1 Tax=Brachionus plicatilis TaxID=10195 RepID=A0A3M7S089_BRAPC|nr:hypothetical protein BpHYR1_038440 [Brachionus plicatilis]